MAASSDPVFKRLAAVMDQPELSADPRFVGAIDRVHNQDALDGIIGEWTSGFVLEELEPLLHARDVPASRVFTMADIFRDPHFAARGTITHAPDPVLGSIAMPAPAPRLSNTPGVVRHAGGDVGADTVKVLRTIGHMSEDEIAALLDSGAAFDLTHARGLASRHMGNTI
jgi:crotonobetainyl-CoA:carnitine CoA-transferase CaiB-like acyl-CoA transferase